ncbi:MAG: hypothetical protein ABW158_22930, partial [Candidatus Thiodiazotropha sp. 6PDIVS]
DRAGSYTILGAETLQDGTPGFKVQATLDDTTHEAYFNIGQQNGLCFSSNLEINTVRYTFLPNQTPSVDYQNCLSLYSAASDPNPNPNPNPNPSTEDPNLEGLWLTSNCIRAENGASAKILYKFEANEVFYSMWNYENLYCTGEPAVDDFLSFEPPINYSYLGAETIPDGSQGHSLRVSRGTGTVDGYYLYNSQNRLCSSYAFGFSFITGENQSLDIDYQNCLIKGT